MKEFSIEGRQPVLEALKAGRKIKTVYIAEGTSGATLEEIKSRAKKLRIKVRYIPRQELEKISVTGSEQGVVALGEPKAYVEVEDILNAAEAKGNNLYFSP